MFDTEMLFPERVKYRGKGPADCKWYDSQPITALTISKPTGFDGEAMQVTVPVFKEDSFEDLATRFHVLLALGDNRMIENNAALIKSEELVKEQQAKKAFEAQMRSATLVAAKKAAKSGDLKAVEQIAGGAIDKTPDHPGSTDEG